MRTIRRVWEPNAAGSFLYESVYQYDPLDNLTRVDQKGNDANSANWRTRTFTYNSLSQLLTAANPESGAVSYTYDNDGNLTKKVDARGITICYGTWDNGVCNTSGANSGYDELHRLKKKTYSDGTATVTYGYDGFAPIGCTPTLTSANPIGRRTGMCDAAGWEAWSYEIVLNSGWKTTDRRSTNGVSKDFVYQNNLAGSLWKLTYPSGRTIEYHQTAAGRTDWAKDAAYTINYAQRHLRGARRAGVVAERHQHLFDIHLQQPAPALPHYDFHKGVDNNGNVYKVTNKRDPNRTQNFTHSTRPAKRDSLPSTSSGQAGQALRRAEPAGVGPDHVESVGQHLCLRHLGEPAAEESK